MNEKRLVLAERQGALKARIALQREQLAAHAWPLEEALALGDKAVAGADWVKANPVPVGAAVAVVALLKPARAWRWAKRGFLAWRGWRKVQDSLSGSR